MSQTREQLELAKRVADAVKLESQERREKARQNRANNMRRLWKEQKETAWKNPG